MRALITGGTGFIGGLLARRLVGEHEVRCLVRDADRAHELESAGCELRVGDVLEPGTLEGAGGDVDVAYYLVHSMGRGSGRAFAERERAAAANFAEAMRRDGAKRVVYLGGLGNEPGSEHLRSRHESAEVLARAGPPLTYFRAAMVVGAGSESYRTLRSLVERLPVMIAPAWLRIRTQPIAVGDVIDYLAAAPSVEASAGREVQIGGPELLPYGEMIDRMAAALGKRRPPKLPMPLLTPWLSSLWIGLVTPVDAGVARPLVEGLSTETVVTDESGMRLFDVEPTHFDEALRLAIEEDDGA